jgi:hypothetical protein
MAGPRWVSRATEDQFWAFVRERHAIYERRKRGKRRPWTQDPILHLYKFTNIYRELDKTTVALRAFFRDDVRCYHRDPAAFVFNVVWARWTSWPASWATLGYRREWDPVVVKAKLHARRLAGEKVFTGAYIICAAPNRAKIDSIVDAATAVWKDREALHAVCRASKSLQAAAQKLTEYYLIGKFMAYEVVTDLRHTPVLSDAKDINTWANPGPGAKRGLMRLHGPLGTPGRLAAMRALLSHSRLHTRLPWMELRDIEHALCEWDKYCRVLYAEGTPRTYYANGPTDADLLALQRLRATVGVNITERTPMELVLRRLSQVQLKRVAARYRAAHGKPLKTADMPAAAQQLTVDLQARQPRVRSAYRVAKAAVRAYMQGDYDAIHGG